MHGCVTGSTDPAPDRDHMSLAPCAVATRKDRGQGAMPMRMLPCARWRCRRSRHTEEDGTPDRPSQCWLGTTVPATINKAAGRRAMAPCLSPSGSTHATPPPRGSPCILRATANNQPMTIPWKAPRKSSAPTTRPQRLTRILSPYEKRQSDEASPPRRAPADASRRTRDHWCSAPRSSTRMPATLRPRRGASARILPAQVEPVHAASTMFGVPHSLVIIVSCRGATVVRLGTRAASPTALVSRTPRVHHQMPPGPSRRARRAR